MVVWSEGTASVDPTFKDVYPKDINFAIAEGLKPLETKGWEVVMASLNDPDQGISDEGLNSTDVLIWWGHKKHGEVKDELVNKIAARVTDGKMGFIGTHSCHFAKPFKKLMGTRCSWREYVADGTSAEIIVKEPDHPICKGVKNFKLPKIERYGEPFAVPTPEAVPLECTIKGQLMSDLGLAAVGSRGITASVNPTTGAPQAGVPGLRFVPSGFAGDANSSTVLFTSQRTVEGGYSVREAFAEFGIPLLKGGNLNFDEAIRGVWYTGRATRSRGRPASHSKSHRGLDCEPRNPRTFARRRCGNASSPSAAA